MNRLRPVRLGSLALGVLLLCGCAGFTPDAPKTALGRIAETRTLTLGFREDARPFSYKADDGKPDGYSVELCRRVAASLQKQLGGQPLDVRWVPVTVATRIDAVTDGRIDIECGSTSRTLTREQRVDFSNATWVDGSSFVTTANSPLRDTVHLHGKRVGVIPGTTTEVALKALAQRGVVPVFVPLATHTDGVAAVRDGRVDAYATDRMILVGEVLGGPDGPQLRLSEDYVSLETYGLMMRRDPELRLAVNRALATVFRDGEIEGVMRDIFGSNAKPTPILSAAFALSALPE